MKYIVRKNPNDNKWYALGHVGDNQWMPVSDGYSRKKQAQKYAAIQVEVDAAARNEIKELN